MTIAVIFGILWKSACFMVTVGFWCVVARFILHKVLKAAGWVTKKCIVPLIKDVSAVVTAYRKAKENSKPEKEDDKNKVEAYILDR